MSGSTEKTNAAAGNKDQPMQKEALAGTKQEKEVSVWEKAADTIAGDNKLMGAALKIVLSPITLIAGAGLIIYLLFKVKALKEETEKLKEENKKSGEEKSSRQGEYEQLKEENEKLKQLCEMQHERSLAGTGPVPQQLTLDKPDNKTYNTAYLD